MAVRDVKVTAVTGSRVTVKGRITGLSSRAFCTGMCNTSTRNGAFAIVLGAGSRATENGLSLSVATIAAGAAVVKIAPAA